MSCAVKRKINRQTKKKRFKDEVQESAHYTAVLVEDLKDQFKFVIEKVGSLDQSLSSKIDRNHNELKQEIGDTRRALSSRMDRFDKRMDGFDTRMDRFDTRMDRFDTRMDGFNTKIGGLDTKIDAVCVELGNKIDRINDVVIRHDEEIEKLKKSA
jgi:predicted  nucleic acid-binding Zn-ribbon protein